MIKSALKVLVTGGRGQLGTCMRVTKPKEIEGRFLSSEQFNLTNSVCMTEQLEDFRPDIVVNCAAYTNVDGAESDQANAYAINHQGVSDLANLCKTRGTLLIHISTDFVFSGTHTLPYSVNDATAPLGVYGATKRGGEEAIQKAYKDGAVILRTSWLYSEFGGNFVKTMLRLFETKDDFSVVNDQFGSPTYARGLAQVVWSIIQADKFVPGFFHWSDFGVTTWFDFAFEIGRQAEELGLLANAAKIEPISASDYGNPTPRPSYSVLDCNKTVATYSVQQRQWSHQLTEMLKHLQCVDEPQG